MTSSRAGYARPAGASPVQSAGRSGLGSQTSPATAVTVPREAGVADDADQGTSTSSAKVDLRTAATPRPRSCQDAARMVLLTLTDPRSPSGTLTLGWIFFNYRVLNQNSICDLLMARDAVVRIMQYPAKPFTS
jgi:hypothetical protein